MTSMSIEEAFEGLRAEVRVETVAPTAAGTVLGVVRPASTAEVQTCLRWAAQHQVPVVTIGTGARLDRDVVLDGALVVSTELLTGVRTNHDGTITAWAGTRTEDVLAAVADRGEWLPLTAGPSSTIGGDIATAPGTGLPTLDLRAHLVSVQVVLADGQTVRAAGTASSGPTALGNLFVGSHGLLGVITEVTLRPTARPDRSVALVAFDDPAVAGNAALEMFFAAPSVEAQL
ncbi:MAG TPA: FAD-binding oxidoreductase, partial [Jatrophihabitantaceae bacterium]|nr:FAD-binding oxidoreductase [Jatrophihabitantaceae bacterium]